MPRILVIDDDTAVAKTVKMVLERSGHKVAVAHDGLSGTRAADTGAFDVLIVDIFMPGMDGFETLRALRARRPTTPILIMSGLIFRDTAGNTPDFLTMATKLGATASLHKPFTPKELLRAVEKCLSPGGPPEPIR